MAPVSLPRDAAALLARAARSTEAGTSSALAAATRTLGALARRQTIVAIPTTYQTLNDGPSPGLVAGIVLGAVGGTVLALWMIYTCLNLSGGGGVQGEVVVERRRSEPSRSSRRASEVIEVRSPPRRHHRERVRETIVMEESRRSAPIEVIEEDESDIVEVIEEHSPPPRRHRDRDRRVSGYRNVDPDEFGGGDRPMRKVRR